MRPNRQIASAPAQVMTNRPTMMKPASLMLKLDMKSQKPPENFSCAASRPKISMVPINIATTTESPVMVML